VGRGVILAIVQARMSSTRMPGKVMAPILGEPMIWRQLERIRRARTLTRVVVATSAEASDDPLASYLVSRGQAVFRGALHDVLGRFAECADAASDPSHVVRLTADCPLADPGVIDSCVRLAQLSGAAYASNCEKRSYPDGLDVEALTTAALRVAAAEADAAYDREHVTPFVRTRPDRFPQAHLVHHRDWSRLRWTVDTPADFAFAKAVYEALWPHDPCFAMDDVLDLVEHRLDIAELNAA
jgi:spore coat polysaccharide biosynthesis protein SpsF